jgi:hypothetical protein
MKHPEYMQGLMFQASRSDQGDPDKEVMTRNASKP